MVKTTCNNIKTNNKINRLGVYYFDLPKYEDERDEHIQTGVRPCVIVSNDLCNQYSSVITVIPITSKDKNNLSTHLHMNSHQAYQCGLSKPSTLLAEGITSVSKKRIIKKIGEMDKGLESKVQDIINAQLGMN